MICGELASLARVQDYNLLWGGGVHPRLNADASVEEAQEVCQRFIQRKVAGVFFAPFEHIEDKEAVNRQLAESLRQAGIAVTLLDRDLGGFPTRSEFDVVGIDNFAGGYLLAEHLLKLRCRHLVFVARPRSAPTVNARIAGAARPWRHAGRRSRRISSGWANRTTRSLSLPWAPDAKWMRSSAPTTTRRRCSCARWNDRASACRAKSG